MVVALLVAHALLRSLSHTKLLRHVGCEACAALAAGAGRGEPHHSNKASKSSRKRRRPTPGSNQNLALFP